MKAYQLVNKEMKDEGGALYLIGGRPAMGKTAFMINIAVEMARAGKQVGYISLELKRDELLQWMVRSTGSKEEIDGLMIDILDEERVRPEDIERYCLHDKDVIFIDYLQLVDRGEGDLVGVVKDIKDIADRLGLQIFALSQLPRTIEIREDHKPVPEDLKDFGFELSDFEQIFLIYREHYYDKLADDTKLTVITKDQEEQLIWDPKTISVM